MVYKEEIRDLFSVPDNYCLAHCISADFGMGRGIVVEFNRQYDMKRKLQKKFPDYCARFHCDRIGGDCILEGRVLNLITKERYYQKPTYASLKRALQKMKEICIREGITQIAMPTIGCGLDRLEWDKVSAIIKEVFADTNIEILVCKFN